MPPPGCLLAMLGWTVVLAIAFPFARRNRHDLIVLWAFGCFAIITLPMWPEA